MTTDSQFGATGDVRLDTVLEIPKMADVREDVCDESARKKTVGVVVEDVLSLMSWVTWRISQPQRSHQIIVNENGAT